jgi:hypothetical protein
MPSPSESALQSTYAAAAGSGVRGHTIADQCQCAKWRRLQRSHGDPMRLLAHPFRSDLSCIHSVSIDYFHCVVVQGNTGAVLCSSLVQLADKDAVQRELVREDAHTPASCSLHRV